MSSRRELLRLGTLAGVAALFKGTAEAARPTMGASRAADKGPLPTRQQLLAQVNAPFVIQRPNYPDLSLVLVSVSDPLFARKGTQQDSFRATFRAPAMAGLAQDMYAVFNKSLGEFPIFLVPVGAPSARTRYFEAAFNRVATE